MILNILLKPPVDHLKILKFLFQKRMIRLLLHPIQLLRPDAILAKFRDLGFQLADKARLLQMPAVQDQLLLKPPGHLAQHHGFSHIVQHCRNPNPQILKNTVGQTLKAQNVHVHKAVSGMEMHQLLLGLHGILLRDNKQKGAFRLL